MSAKTAKTKRNASAPTVTSLSIEEQTAAFLKAGGKIEEVSSGVSGQTGLTGHKPSAFSSKGKA